MKIILTKDTPKIGKRGQLVDVAEGFARNFLIKKGLALPATDQAQLQHIRQIKESQQKLQAKTDKITKQITQLQSKIFTIKVKTGDKDQIFGGVSAPAIIQSVYAKTNIQLEAKQLQLPKRVKNLGEHEVIINFGNNQKTTIKIKLEALN